MSTPEAPPIYQPRQSWNMPSTPAETAMGFAESDEDYTNRNLALAVFLLDQYGNTAPDYLGRFPEHARPFVTRAYEDGFLDGVNAKDGY